MWHTKVGVKINGDSENWLVSMGVEMGCKTEMVALGDHVHSLQYKSFALKICSLSLFKNNY